MDTVLITEDSALVRSSLKSLLEKQGYLTLEAANGKRLLDVIDRYPVDLILLDLNLPDGSALDLMEDLRKKSQVPLIIISGEKCKDMRIQCFKKGADDFVLKPFDKEELLARIQANMRRHHMEEELISQLSDGQDDNADDLSIGCWTLDGTKYQIVDEQGEEGNLTIREFNLLSHLVRNKGRVMKRYELCEAIRQDKYVPNPRTIDVKITRIRKKIGDDADDPKLIRTVRGVGYIVPESE